MPYLIDNFKGGISEFENIGLPGSYKFGYGLDIRKKQRTLSCCQKLKKESGATVTDLILFFVTASDGATYGFGDSGKIYKRTSGGSWSLKYTDSNGKITGAFEWNGYMYWACENGKISRKPFEGSSDWSDVSHDWNDLAVTGWHTMREAAGALYICNGSYLAMVGYDHTFTAQALDIIPGNVLKVLEEYDQQILMGSEREDEGNRGYIWRWNGSDASWGRKRRAASGINAMAIVGHPIIQAGTKGQVYIYDFITPHPLLQFPGESGYVNPGAIDTDESLCIMGLSGGTYCGIYSYGKKRYNANRTLVLDYLISAGTMDGVEIGAVKKAGSTMIVSWKDGASYGADVIDTANKVTAIYESLVFDAGRPDIEKHFSTVKITMKPLPSGCSVKAWYRTCDNTAWQEAIFANGETSFETENGTVAEFTIDDNSPTLEIKTQLTPSGNSTPEIISIKSGFEYVDEH